MRYSYEYKLRCVELYGKGEWPETPEGISKKVFCNEVRIWHRIAEAKGPDALRPKKKGRKKSMAKDTNQKRKSQSADEGTVDTSKEYVKQLEDELLKLRIENAYLKELRRLRLEEEALLKKQRESSTASEENSD